jgi:hypothetical protein
MKLTSIDTFFWATGIIGEAALFFVLLRHKGWRNFPAFTAQRLFNLSFGLAMVLVYRWGSSHLYAQVYWSTALIDFFVQMAIVIELARVVLRPTGTWVRDARQQFFISGAAGVAIAAACALMVTPPLPNMLASLEVRSELFSSLLICELVLATTLASNRLGLGWRNHVMAIGQGLMGWSLVAVIVDGLHSYYGYGRYFKGLEHVRMVTYLGAIGYWCVQLWHEEPARQPISPQLRQYILALHHRVNYDLGEAER